MHIYVMTHIYIHAYIHYITAALVHLWPRGEEGLGHHGAPVRPSGLGGLAGGGLAFGLADQKEGNSDPLGGLGKVRMACIGRRERRFGTFVFSDGLYLEGNGY